MAQIIRLNTKFNNDNLKKLINYDTTKIINEITSVATLRAFYDCTNMQNMTIRDGRVTQLNDLSNNQLHFKQDSTLLAPLFDENAFGGVGGIKFDGAHFMRADNLFSNAKQATYLIFMQGALNASGTEILLCGRNNPNINVYITHDLTKAFGGNLVYKSTPLNAEPSHIFAAYNAITKQGALCVNSGKVSGPVNYGGKADDVYIGRWSDGYDNNKYKGWIGHIAIFDEDLSKNDAVVKILNEYVLRKYR